MPIWLLSVLAATGFLASGGGAYFFYSSRRKQAKAVALPDLIRLLPPRVTPALAAPSTPSLSASMRRALPSPFRWTRALSLDEQARLEHVAVFLRSIPLPEVSSNLDWLEEIIETNDVTKEDAHEQILEGNSDLVYKPDWLQHPTYVGLRQMPPLQPLMQSLEEYVKTINECTRDTVTLLRGIAAELSAEQPLEAGNRWRFILSIGLGTLTWFWGTHLANPSSRDFVTEPSQESEDVDPNELLLASLDGVESSPFAGLILEGLTENETVFFRDLHIQLRITYRINEAAQALTAKLASTDLMRHQIVERTSQLGRLPQQR